MNNFFKKKESETGGYVSLFSVFIMVVILIVAGFYGWQKYQEKKYPDKAARGEIKGLTYYVHRMRANAVEILEQREVRSKRALELAGGEKNIIDKANLFSVNIPESWVIEAQEVNSGNKISYLSARSSYFSFHETAGKRFYDAGCRFMLTVTAGDSSNAAANQAEGTDLVKTGRAGGQAGSYEFRIMKDKNSENGNTIETFFFKNGKIFHLQMLYNPKNFREAEFTFNEIAYSFSFK